MDKDFMQINDSELEAVAGGLDTVQVKRLFNCTTAEVASAFLSQYVRPGTAEYDKYMNLWKMNHRKY